MRETIRSPLRPWRCFVILVAALSLACSTPPADEPEPTGSIEPIAVPAAEGSAEPNLVSARDGRLYLSWIEPARTGHALRFSTLEGSTWSAPRTIATGDDWFVNWADFPSMAALADGTLAAHWLVKSAAETYAYDVVLAVSGDAGATWSDPVRPHRDGTATEHGFASLVARDDAFEVVWLDGRRMAADPPGPMTLRHARLAPDGTVGPVAVLDDAVCDCCPTDAVLAGESTLVVYRDRDPGEVRDIYATSFDGSDWRAPAAVHADNWVIAGCPVNGPAAEARGQHVAVAWYSAPEGEPGSVQVAFSTDGGQAFGAPVRVDGGSPLGRVDVTWLNGDRVGVTWLEQEEDGAALRLRPVAATGSAEPAITLTGAAMSRQSGFPKLVRHDGRLYAAWTEVAGETRVRSGHVTGF